jgi:hypothetical protein
MPNDPQDVLRRVQEQFRKRGIITYDFTNGAEETWQHAEAALYRPEGDASQPTQSVRVVHTSQPKAGYPEHYFHIYHTGDAIFRSSEPPKGFTPWNDKEPRWRSCLRWLRGLWSRECKTF